MKADPWQQHHLRKLVELDTELARAAHRAANLAEQKRVDELTVAVTAAEDAVAVVGLALDDLDGAIAKLESEIDGVRKREERDRKLLDSGVDGKAQAELAHELETLERRQSALEDSELEVMEERETLTARRDENTATCEQARIDLAEAIAARDAARTEIESSQTRLAAERSELTGQIDADLLALYERQRATTGSGAGVLQGRRCGACRIEIDRGESARIAAAAADEVVRCPECGAILLRIEA
ncbi:MAG: C4-type zinc ribbon domain-containing protein [Mycolicibacterium insubricum]|nr:hypothetical protein [Mycobacterium sp.]